METTHPTQAFATADWLQDHLDDPDVRVVEVDVSRAAQDEGHIPGAVLWNIYVDLKNEGYGPRTDEEVDELLARSGITPDTTVVTYGYAPALGVWLLRHRGQADVRMLGTSRAAWRDSGRPWTATPSRPTPAARAPWSRDEAVRSSREDVLARNSCTSQNRMKPATGLLAPTRSTKTP